MRLKLRTSRFCKNVLKHKNLGHDLDKSACIFGLFCLHKTQVRNIQAGAKATLIAVGFDSLVLPVLNVRTKKKRATFFRALKSIEIMK